MQPYFGFSSTKEQFLNELSNENFLPEKSTDGLNDEKSEPLFPFKTVNIQDPFRPYFNITATADFKSCMAFMRSLIEICDLFIENNTIMKPETEVWGLCSLFKPPISDLKLVKPTKIKHQIKLQTKPDAAKKLKKIFEHGLLFQCKEFNVSGDTDSNSKLILKMQCRTRNNTWQGRDLVMKNYINSKKGTLEIEHMASEEMLKYRTNSVSDLLCEFICECREVVVEHETELILDIDFKSKFPYILAVFLKKYIPDVFNKL